MRQANLLLRFLVALIVLNTALLFVLGTEFTATDR